MSKFFNIEFAPLHVPLERCLQTLAVLFHVFTFFHGVSLIGFSLFFCFLFSPFFLLPLIYLAWYIYDYGIQERGGRRFDIIRRWTLWKYVAAYFPMELVKTVDLDSSKNYIFGIFPHGVMSLSAMINFASEANGFSLKFPGITPHLCTLNMNFYPPLNREFIMSLGLIPASRESLTYILTNQGKCKDKGQVIQRDKFSSSKRFF